jgi:hypothetical protein
MNLRVLTVALVMAALVAPAARANGDPASDYLLSQSTFIPFDAKVPKEQAEQLNSLVADAKEKGFTVRVALIATELDLGAVPSLWLKPETYARFLGQELFFVYKGRLLIVMPNGFGFSRGGKLVPAGQRAIERLPNPGAGGPALTTAAMRAVQRLAAQSGVRVTIPKPSSGGSAASDRIVIAAIAGGVIALLLAGFALRRFLLRRS